ncbi:MAG: TIR domain-containing protein [Phycisphaerales bacterium]|nr:TIR domain-containing protein [Phycisphaerales bacterium]
MEEVDRALQRFLKPENVFYDRRFEHRLARIDLLPYLQSIYHDRSELVVVFLCADYERKDWCRMEWRALLDIIKKRRGSSIMPFRFDDCEIPGFYSTDGYVDVGTRTPDAVAELISKRLSHNRQERDSPDATG